MYTAGLLHFISLPAPIIVLSRDKWIPLSKLASELELTKDRPPPSQRALLQTSIRKLSPADAQLLTTAISRVAGSSRNDHALARLMQRAPGINLPRVLMEAQDQFFAADVATVRRHIAHDTSLYLRAGPGLLICKALRGRTPTQVLSLLLRKRAPGSLTRWSGPIRLQSRPPWEMRY
jgi:hypothetical protein